MTVFAGGENMKKGLSALLALVLIMGLLAGCGSKEEETVKKEMNEIITSMNNNEQTYKLKYYTDVKFTFLVTTSRK